LKLLPVKNKKSPNKFDLLVERLIAEFAKIQNFDLLTTDEIGNKVFNIITFRIAEVTSYKELVCQHFIPATNKAIVDSQRDFVNSSTNFYSQQETWILKKLFMIPYDLHMWVFFIRLKII